MNFWILNYCGFSVINNFRPEKFHFENFAVPSTSPESNRKFPDYINFGKNLVKFLVFETKPEKAHPIPSDIPPWQPLISQSVSIETLRKILTQRVIDGSSWTGHRGVNSDFLRTFRNFDIEPLNELYFERKWELTKIKFLLIKKWLIQRKNSHFCI